MRNHRLLAGVAAALIAGAGILSVTAGGAPPVPPPVTLRGASPDSMPVATDGLELVPAPIVDLDDSAPATADSPDDAGAGSPSPDGSATIDTADSDTPDPAPSPTAESADSPDVVSTDSDSPDRADADTSDSPDSADSPDD